MHESSASIHPIDQGRDPISTARVRDLAAEVAAHYDGEFADAASERLLECDVGR